MKTLSVVIPVYNEEKTVSLVLDLVSKAPLSIGKEIIVVNDGSTDKTEAEIKKFLKNYKKHKNVQFKYYSKPNGGKGSAVKYGFAKATGDIIIIQDADMEYDPNEYQKLIDPILQGKYKVIYGSRRLNRKNKAYSNISFFLGGIAVSALTNILYASRLTDEPTCYKVFRSDVIKGMKIKGNKFEWEPEVTAKILKKGIKIKEIPISYFPRHTNEGKKINWKDGMQALWTLIYWRVHSD